MYAAGKIPGGFIKRESRPSEAAILAARLTDRPIRPLFPEGYKDDVQLVITVLSTDQENDPDVLGTIAASAALTISEIPFQGPIGAVRVGRIDGEFVVNPTFSQLADSELDLIVSGTRDAIMMVEAGAKLLPEDVMAEAILFGHRALQPLIDLQERAPRARRQAEAPAVPRARHRVGPRLRRGRRGQDGARRRRRRDDRPRSEDGRPRRDRRRPDQGRQDRRPLVDVRQPGSRDRRSPDARHHRHGRQGRPDAEGGGRDVPRVRRRRRSSSATTSASTSASSRQALGDGFRFEPGTYLDTLVLAREAYPDWAESYKLGDLARFFGIELSDAHRALPGRRGDRRSCSASSPSDLPNRIATLRDGIAASIRANRTRRRPQGPARGGPPPGAGQQEPVRARPQEDRPRARPLGGDPDGRPRRRRDPPDHRRGRAPARAPTAPACSPAARRRPSRSPPSAPSSDVQRIDTISPETEKRYLHHYNMPPYSTGENKPMRGPGRREIGHGNLAERALLPGPAEPRGVPVRHPARAASA